jgi:hypothetical protein
MPRPLDRLILGDNPFIGVEHLDQSKDREKKMYLTQEWIINVMNEAFRNGATAFMFSTHDLIYQVLTVAKQRGQFNDISLYPLFPYAAKYVKIATEKGTVGLVDDIISKLGMLGTIKSGLSLGIGILTRDLNPIIESFIKLEINPYIDLLGEKRLKAVLLHEIIVDLCIGLDLKDPINFYINHIRDDYNLNAGIVSRNFPLLVQKLEEWGLQPDIIVTPFNKAGFQMTPSRADCEKSLTGLSENISLIAMSPLAAGLIKPEDAFDYLKTISRLNAVVMGVSRPEHAKSSFSIAREKLGI